MAGICLSVPARERTNGASGRAGVRANASYAAFVLNSVRCTELVNDFVTDLISGQVAGQASDLVTDQVTSQVADSIKESVYRFDCPFRSPTRIRFTD